MTDLITHSITQFSLEVWTTLVELSPSLLLGLLIAGLLHVFLPTGLIHKQMQKSNFASVFKAVMVGVPMPLCSCGVVPTTLGLRREGASRGAATGFLISTPQTGVDSILVSASFLGWPFALFKVASAFVTGLFGGHLVNLTEPSDSSESATPPAQEKPLSVGQKTQEIFRYAVLDILASIDIWIVVGLLISAGITLAVPAGSLAEYSWVQGFGGMFLVLAMALPLYVCATGSVPIAAALIGAGMPLGSALVFLMAGPATNAATIGAIFKALGLRVVVIYVGVVAVMSMGLGMLFNWLLVPVLSDPGAHHHGGQDWLGIASAVVVGLLLGWLLFRRVHRRIQSLIAQRKKDSSMVQNIVVDGMTCQHCVANVKKTAEAVEGVTEATPDLQTGEIVLRGDGYSLSEVAAAIETAGYKATLPG